MQASRISCLTCSVLQLISSTFLVSGRRSSDLIWSLMPLWWWADKICCRLVAVPRWCWWIQTSVTDPSCGPPRCLLMSSLRPCTNYRRHSWSSSPFTRRFLHATQALCYVSDIKYFNFKLEFSTQISLLVGSSVADLTTACDATCSYYGR